MATVTENPELENPNKTLTTLTPNITDLTVKSNNCSDEFAADKISGEPKEETGTLDNTTAVVSPSNDIDKKVRRAERFGVPVQLSEQEKRNSRAERFGTSAGSEVSKTSENQKKKARADRFGLLPVSADEEAKKKARLARFGSDTKTDSVEEDKRKARALRFSQPSTNAVQHVNGREDVNSNTAVAGNAVEGA